MQEQSDWRSPVGCTTDSKEHTSFLQWCKRSKLRFPNCQLKYTDSTGRCVIASESVAIGEVVVEVPDSIVLMADNCSLARELADSGFSKDTAEDEIYEVQGLILAVMYEKLIGSKSRWSAYLDFLPDDVSHLPFTWKRKEILQLKGTSAYDKMQGRVQHPADAPTKVKELFREMAQPFVSENFGVSMSEAQVYRLYCWATAVVASYSFILGDDKYQAMVPMWDMLNHITGRANVRLHHDSRRGVLQMIATADIAAGEEVVNNYGPHSNSELLRGYGFVELNNCNENAQVPARFVLSVCAVTLAAAALSGSSEAQRPSASSLAPSQPDQQHSNDAAGCAAAAPGPARKRKGLQSPDALQGPDPHSNGGSGRAGKRAKVSDGAQQGDGRGDGSEGGTQEQSANGLPDAPAPCPRRVSMASLRPRMSFCRRHGIIPHNGVFKIPDHGGPPPELTELVRILLLPEGEFDALRRAAARWRVPRTRPMHSGMDPACLHVTVQAMQDLLDKMLARYTCSLQEDQDLLETLPSLPPRLAAAVVARAGEKRCLHSCREWLTARPRSLLDHPVIAWQQPADPEPPQEQAISKSKVPRQERRPVATAGTVAESLAGKSRGAAEQQPFLFNFNV